MNCTFTNRICTVITLIMLPSALLSGGFSQKSAESKTVRIVLFNIWEMSTEKISQTDSNSIGVNEQLLAAAGIIKTINPDVLIINEIDHDVDAFLAGEDLALNARRFNSAYLNQGNDAVNYPYAFAAPCNTGFLSGKDLDNNGRIATGADIGTNDHGVDSYGYGRYPGQYSMAVLSRYELRTGEAKTFQKFLWKDLPGNLIPEDWYSQDELEVFRLSSKSHWDLPVRIGGATVHLLISHPTPPVFDGPEDRNGRRNYDEIRMWVHYINGDSVLVDDKGRRGGLAEDRSFVIAGDLNADPNGEILETGLRAIDQLLNHPKVNNTGEVLISDGALMGQAAGPPEYNERRTTGRSGRGRRIDYLLPSKDLKIADGGVFWPDSKKDPDGNALVQKASDHRMIWLDIVLDD